MKDNTGKIGYWKVSLYPYAECSICGHRWGEDDEYVLDKDKCPNCNAKLFRDYHSFHANKETS